MEKLSNQSKDISQENIEKIEKIFPNCVTETMGEDGKIKQSIDFDILKQDLSDTVVEDKTERYQFTWPGKNKAILLANAPTTNTLRPLPEKSVDFDHTKNIYIEGDNLEALKILRETYLGKVRMIYIDPPYNTGNDFVFEDDFKESTEEYLKSSGNVDDEGNRMAVNSDTNGRFHSDWLNMMYPRLILARDFLTDDGVIFISIDDNEVENLRTLCDQVFGAFNFIAHIIHKNNSMKNQSKFIGVSTEFVLIYAKNLEFLNKVQGCWRIKKKGASDINTAFRKMKEQGLSLEKIHEEIMELYSRPKYAHLSRWNKIDEYGVFMDSDLSRTNGPKNFSIINPNTGKECPIPNRGWGKSKEELLRLQEEHLIWYGDENTPPRMKSYLSDDAESVFDNFVFADTSADKKLIDQLFGSPVFDFPKSMELIKQLISLCTKKDDLVLDFFSGSATTAHSVIQLNREDNLNRRFILVQIPEKTPANSEAFKAGYNTICDIGEERIRRAGKKIKDESPLTTQDLDVGFRVFKVDSSNMKDLEQTPQSTQLSLLENYDSTIKEGRTSLDLVIQTMIRLGISLDAEISRKFARGGTEYYAVNGNDLVCCFARDVPEKDIEELARLQPLNVAFRDDSFASDQDEVNCEQIFKTLSPITGKNIFVL